MTTEFDQSISLGIDGGHNIRSLFEGHLHSALGLEYQLRQNGNLHAKVQNSPHSMGITVYRIEDIPARFEEGAITHAMIGRDRARELQLGGLEIEEIAAFGFSICWVALEAPIRSPIRRVEDLAGDYRVATSYPNITEDFFNGIKGASIRRIVLYHGGEESAVDAGLADLVVAVTNTGTAAKDNHLRVIKPPILASEGVLVASSKYLRDHGEEEAAKWFKEVNQKVVEHPDDLMEIRRNGQRGSGRWAIPAIPITPSVVEAVPGSVR